MFIFMNPFRILFNSNGFEVPIEFKKFLLALKIKQSFILLIYFHITRFGKSWDVTVTVLPGLISDTTAKRYYRKLLEVLPRLVQFPWSCLETSQVRYYRLVFTLLPLLAPVLPLVRV